MRWLWRLLAGEDGQGKTALPLGEFLHPVPLAALVILIVNDHVLKGRGPGWLTGKLSDFAGVLFFPLLLTALGDVIACGVARLSGARIDFSLRRWKLLAGMGVTAAIMLGLELSASFGGEFTRTLGRLGVPSATTRDPWDLLALAMLVPAYAIGRAEIRRVPLGRIEVIGRKLEAKEREAGLATKLLDDVKRLRHGDPLVDGLAAACEARDAGAIWRTVAELRSGGR